MEERHVLIRVAVAADLAASRLAKRLPLERLAGRELLVDGYNVLITVESLLGNKPVYRCDDGYLRDTRGIFRKYRSSDLTSEALSRTFDLLVPVHPSRVDVLLDQQISMSGRLAVRIDRLLEERTLPGTARTARDVDRRLKEGHASGQAVVATSDGHVIDVVSEAVDLPAEIARELNIRVLSI
jgi:hypothetical protein